MIRGYRDYQSLWVNPLACADGELLCERETGNSHNPQAMAIKRGDRWYPSCKLLGTCIIPINLFDIHVRFYKCVKIWMVKFWKIFGQSFQFRQILAAPKFPFIQY